MLLAQSQLASPGLSLDFRTEVLYRRRFRGSHGVIAPLLKASADDPTQAFEIYWFFCSSGTCHFFCIQHLVNMYVSLQFAPKYFKNRLAVGLSRNILRELSVLRMQTLQLDLIDGGKWEKREDMERDQMEIKRREITGNGEKGNGEGRNRS